ncbi:uncharacterized protein BJ171DRAFT_582370 [Polychytrium aggregatum]|uniref:uncharacterized protein n=1 Tax=Polychytrium aggregatum TaxID=110093 RepID=UPI0022FF3DD0|nr:uncharacterized protein BJ171DRAFT_582370 [Polychytrium aggregatum]KAI9203991.1 hypothetical protein BJ171DRAFT_582370 [Polychytrium aggregatum]
MSATSSTTVPPPPTGPPPASTSSPSAGSSGSLSATSSSSVQPTSSASTTISSSISLATSSSILPPSTTDAPTSSLVDTLTALSSSSSSHRPTSTTTLQVVPTLSPPQNPVIVQVFNDPTKTYILFYLSGIGGVLCLAILLVIVYMGWDKNANDDEREKERSLRAGSRENTPVMTVLSPPDGLESRVSLQNPPSDAAMHPFGYRMSPFVPPSRPVSVHITRPGSYANLNDSLLPGMPDEFIPGDVSNRESIYSKPSRRNSANRISGIDVFGFSERPPSTLPGPSPAFISPSRFGSTSDLPALTGDPLYPAIPRPSSLVPGPPPDSMPIVSDNWPNFAYNPNQNMSSSSLQSKGSRRSWRGSHLDPNAVAIILPSQEYFADPVIAPTRAANPAVQGAPHSTSATPSSNVYSQGATFTIDDEDDDAPKGAASSMLQPPNPKNGSPSSGQSSAKELHIVQELLKDSGSTHDSPVSPVSAVTDTCDGLRSDISPRQGTHSTAPLITTPQCNSADPFGDASSIISNEDHR